MISVRITERKFVPIGVCIQVYVFVDCPAQIVQSVPDFFPFFSPEIEEHSIAGFCFFIIHTREPFIFTCVEAQHNFIVIICHYSKMLASVGVVKPENITVPCSAYDHIFHCYYQVRFCHIFICKRQKKSNLFYKELIHAKAPNCFLVTFELGLKFFGKISWRNVVHQ